MGSVLHGMDHKSVYSFVPQIPLPLFMKCASVKSTDIFSLFFKGQRRREEREEA